MFLCSINASVSLTGKVLITDITYLTYGNGKRAFYQQLRTLRQTAYEASTSLSMDIALNTLRKLKQNHHHLTEDAFIHTNPQFQKLVK
ncbi:hypothetical protein [Lysinibacillus xylanilyticus]|uniref:hypothetical protein n=1 Tax=Lysinibacillus xylanilyticus TaxID=582475 RepID=UPI0037F7139D